MRIFEWAIEDIVAAYPTLSLEHAAAMAVALMRRTGQPCEFNMYVEGFDIDAFEGDAQFVVQITWGPKTEATALRMERTEQRTPIVERAAIAVAMLLLTHLVPDSEIEVMKQTNRADYLLRRKHLAVEVSGTEHSREVSSRRREKGRQVLENPFGYNGYVFICCFEPGRCLIQWSYHSQSE